MDDNTIGVISTLDGRSTRDLQLQQNFNCERSNKLISNINGNGIASLGSNYEERSGKDKQILNQFSCNTRENFTAGSNMIYPRSVKDQAMLKEFNACPCKENFDIPSYPTRNIKYVPIE